VTCATKDVVWDGAIVVGIIEIGRGLSSMRQQRK
jgi:hypothetical protein